MLPSAITFSATTGIFDRHRWNTITPAKMIGETAGLVPFYSPTKLDATEDRQYVSYGWCLVVPPLLLRCTSGRSPLPLTRVRMWRNPQGREEPGQAEGRSSEQELQSELHDTRGSRAGHLSERGSADSESDRAWLPEERSIHQIEELRAELKPLPFCNCKVLKYGKIEIH
jgi:hypothetical protein